MPKITEYYPSISCFIHIFFIIVLFKVLQWILARPSLHALNYYIKYGLYHIYLVFVTGCALVPSLFRPGNSDNIIFARFGFHLSQIAWVFGVKVDTEGKEIINKVKKPIILMCNHQSSLDMLALTKEAPRSTAALAKKELLKVPVFGLVTWLAGTIFIDRKARTETINVMKETALKLKKHKTNVWIFPEGTRQQIDSIAEFKKGGFHLAVQAQIPIVPVVIGNCRNIIDIPNKIFGSGTMRIKILSPIETEGLTKDDVPGLTNKCHDIMVAAYDQIMKDHEEEYANLKPLPNKNKTK